MADGKKKLPEEKSLPLFIPECGRLQRCKKVKLMCIPINVNILELQDLVIDSIDDHPDKSIRKIANNNFC